MTISVSVRQKAEQMLRENCKQTYIAALLGVSEGWVSELKKALGLSTHSKRG
jgi:predicted transcriptional regulator